MTLITIICSFNKSFELWHIIWVCKVDDVNIDVISLKSLSKLFTGGLVFFNWMTNKDDDSLSLIFVHAMLQRQLCDFDCGEKVCFSI